MKLTKKRIEGKCPAMRCKEDANGIFVEYEGEVVSFCDRHTEESGAVECEPIEVVEEEETALVGPDPRVDLQNLIDERKEELAEAAMEYQLTLLEIPDYPVESAEDVEFAEEAVREARAEYKELEADRLKATKPIRDALDEINGWYKPAKKALEEIQRLWRAKVGEGKRMLAAREQELLLKAREAEGAEAHEALVAAAQAKPTGKSTTRDSWSFKIIDANAVPREWLCVDEKKVSAAIKKAKGKIEIPGIRVIHDTYEVVR